MCSASAVLGCHHSNSIRDCWSSFTFMPQPSASLSVTSNVSRDGGIVFQGLSVTLYYIKFIIFFLFSLIFPLFAHCLLHYSPVCPLFDDICIIRKISHLV